MKDDLDKEVWHSPAFPTTHWPELIEASFWSDDRSGDSRRGEEALVSFFQRYTPPLKYFTSALLARRDDLRYLDVDDLIQTFFASKVLDKNFISSAKSYTGNKFRTYLMRSVRNHIYSTHRAQIALKRGGGAVHYSLEQDDNVDVLGNFKAIESSMDASWYANIVILALSRQKDSSKSTARKRQLKAFYLRVIHPCVSAEEPPTFSVVAEQIGARSNKEASSDCSTGKAFFMGALKTEFYLHCTAIHEVTFEQETMFQMIENHFATFCECLRSQLPPSFLV